MNKSISLKSLIIGIMILILSAGILSCTGEAPTVIPDTQSKIVDPEDLGTTFPQLQTVYPGGLQSLDVPAAIATGISPSNPGITLVFSKQIENDTSELYFSLELLENGTTSLSYTLYPNSDSSSIFSVIPDSGLAENTQYTIRIFNTVAENDAPGKTIHFDNLVDMNPPATALVPPPTELNPTYPPYVDFVFETGQETPLDTTIPTVASTNPANGATGVSVDLAATTGYIQIVFNDDSTPMIDPTSVTQSSITLYNVTDSLPVDGRLVLNSAITNFSTYRFYPDESLDYNKQYRIRMSVAGCIKDMSGNSVAQTDYLFNTVASPTDPVVDNYRITAVTATSVTLEWQTSSSSIGHVDLQAAAAYTAAEITYHDTTQLTDFTTTISGLTPNRRYSMRISADNETPGPTGPFDSNTIANGVFRTLPNTTEGISGDYVLSLRNSDKNTLLAVQKSLYETFMIWRDGASSIYGQYINTSAGAADTWNTWGANAGSQVFSADGAISLADNGIDGVIAMVVDSANDIIGDSIYDNAGTLARDWGAGPAGITVYQGTAATPSAALSYSGYVQAITSGTADTNFIYDSTTDFSLLSGLDAGDHVINENSSAALTQHTTITSIDPTDGSLIVLGTDIIDTTSQQYRIGDADVTESATETRASSGTSIYTNTGILDQDDVITNGTHYTYLTTGGSWTAFLDFLYSSARNVTFNAAAALTTYNYLANGTADTDTLYDSGYDFSGAGVQIDDLVINTATGESNFVVSVTGDNNDLVLMNNGGDFLFNTSQSYQILRLTDPGNFVASGINTATGALTITDSGRDFGAEGVQTGDIVYGTGSTTCAEITAVSGATLTLSQQIFAGAYTTQAFIIFRFTGVTVGWIESSNLYAKTLNRENGGFVYPAGITGRFCVTDNSNTIQNPRLLSGSNGNVYCVYESVESGNVNIRGKKIFCNNSGANASFVWTGLADANSYTATGRAVATSTRPDYLVKALHDGQGGVFVLYTSHFTASPWTKTVGVTFISASGTITQYTIADADNPDIALISNGIVAVAYEYNTANGPRIMVQLYNSTPSTVGTSLNVRSAVSSYGQINPRITPDGSSGALVSWLETRYYPSIYYTIYAQHFASGFAVPADQLYGDDRYVGIPVKDAQTDDPYDIEHGILRYNDPVDPDAGLFYWLDERSATAGEVDIYFRNVAD